MDLNKLNELKRIDIPQDNGPHHSYCILNENIGGVTKKVSLISVEHAKKQLGHLCDCTDELTVDEYHTQRECYKLSTQAIIKRPKHGNIKEVQHEAMAMNISRLLGLDTAITTLISYQGQPALFVSFSDIRLLNDFTSGKTFNALIIGKPYTHYSTIKPVGEVLQADCFIHDFGNALAFFYLCIDTDAIGWHCQNKALKKAKSLFIFDQSLMDTDKFILDSRLCLIPVDFLRKHTRHGLGRNRTIIEDSLMSTKFASIMQLKMMGEKIVQYVMHVEWRHHHRAKKIERQLTKELSEEQRRQLTTELSQLQILEKDAEVLKLKIQERIDAINAVFTQISGDFSPAEIRQALILEKLIHNPILFSRDGRPYKNPWTHRHQNNLKKVEGLDNEYIELTFNDRVSPAMIDFIRRRHDIDSLTIA